MTPEQLEAHRVRFEQRFGETISETAAYVCQWRDEVTYSLLLLAEGWQAYQWALADADRAQRAAPGVQDEETWYEKAERLKLCVDYSPSGLDLINHRKVLSAHLCSKPTSTQPPQQSAQPSMQDALAAGDGTLHGAIDYWQAKCAELEAKLVQSAQPQPVAWMREDETGGAMTDAEKRAWIAAGRKEVVAEYTKPLINAAAQPVEVQRDIVDALHELMEWQVKHVDRWHNSAYDNASAVLKRHGIKPTSSEGGAS